mgnify:CR=1 FL=1
MQFLYFQLGCLELGLAAFGQARAFLVALEQFLERQIVALHLLDDAFELFQPLLKGHLIRWVVFFFRGHATGKLKQLGQADKRLGEDGSHHLAVDVGQSVVAALELEGQLLVVDAEQMQDRGLKIVHMHRVAGDVVGEVVRLAVDEARLHPSPGHPDREGPPVVVATPPSSITVTDATAEGNLLSYDGVGPPTVTLYYGVSDKGSTDSGWDGNVSLGPKNTGPFTHDLTGLFPGTHYYYRFKAVNDSGTDPIKLYAGTSVSFQLKTNHTVTSYQATGLPPGMSIDSAGGLISGVPTTTGNFSSDIS